MKKIRRAVYNREGPHRMEGTMIKMLHNEKIGNYAFIHKNRAEKLGFKKEHITSHSMRIEETTTEQLKSTDLVSKKGWITEKAKTEQGQELHLVTIPDNHEVLTGLLEKVKKGQEPEIKKGSYHFKIF
ncbi:hypothetical protein K8R43_04870 [archaeon]|nr:hypothetical protein [archaeon]